MRTLRIDQQTSIDNLRETIQRQTRRVVLQAPTGSGKTVIAADIIRRTRDKDNRALITVPALELVDQTVEALFAHGVREIGVIQAQHGMTDWSRPAQRAGVRTSMRRELPVCGFVVIE